jgi:hypothetical protein
MKDRQPTRPGRVKITPENGAAYYAVMEMADEPTEVGTPPTKVNLLKDSTAALLGGGADMVPDEAFVILKNLVDTANTSANAKARVETGSYKGAGKYGASDPNRLTFAAPPKFLYVSCYMDRHYFFFWCKGDDLVSGHVTYNETQSTGRITVSESGNSVSWYGSDTYAQFDASGKTYKYVAIL